MSEITVSPISRRRFLGTGSVLALTMPQYSRMAPGGPGRRERLLLGIDDHLLPFRRNLCYHLSRPEVRKEPVLAPSGEDVEAPDHQVAHFYGTVLHDQGVYRMWYYARPVVAHPGLACYAESQDGVVWTKPRLGQVDFQGGKDNNIVSLVGREIYGVSVIRDQEESEPGHRYKMVYEHRPEDGRILSRYGRLKLTVRTATSSDGINWSAAPEMALDDQCEHGCFYKHGGMYIVHGHGTAYGEGGGGRRGRQGLVWVSPDFHRWVQGFGEAFALPEPEDAAQRGPSQHYDQVHLGVGAASFGSVCVGVYGRWHNRGWGPGGTSCDLGLIISNDGIHFREPVKGHTYISRKDSPAPSVKGLDFPTILCQGNGILNVGEETRIYHGRWRNAGTAGQTPHSRHYRAEVALATLPRDRWGALGLAPGQTEGWVWSAPFELNDNGQIRVNGEQTEGMRLEISDPEFQLLPEFSEVGSGRISREEGLVSTVTWPKGNLSRLRDRQIRFRVHLKGDDRSGPLLYALYLRDDA